VEEEASESILPSNGRFFLRLENFLFIMIFIVISMGMFSYTAAWQDAMFSVNFSSLHRHASYLRLLLALFVLPLVIVICFKDVEEPPVDCVASCESYFGFEPDEIICSEYEDFDFVDFFAFQLSGMSGFSLFIILLVMFWSWALLREEEDDVDYYESRLVGVMMAALVLEVLSALIVFYVIKILCVTDHTKLYLLNTMAVLNTWSALYERGYCIIGKLYLDYRNVVNIMEYMTYLDEDELYDFEEDPICVICEDYVDEDGYQAACTHLFHKFCLKEWISEYGDHCPECDALFGQRHPHLKIVHDTDSDDDPDDPCGYAQYIDPSIPPEMLEKIVDEMTKFDDKTSFFTELCHRRREGDDEEEYDDDDYDYRGGGNY